MRIRQVTLEAFCLVLAAGTVTVASQAQAATVTAYDHLVPAPVGVNATDGGTFTLRPDATIGADAPGVGEYLAGILRRSTGYPLPVRGGGDTPATIVLALAGAPDPIGDEGYVLDVTGTNVVIRARRAAGLFEGVQ